VNMMTSPGAAVMLLGVNVSPPIPTIMLWVFAACPIAIPTRGAKTYVIFEKNMTN